MSELDEESSGYYGAAYDKHLEHRDESTIGKIQQTYWTTKQTLIQKLGKRQDEHIIASDAELDARLETFQAVQRTCALLQKIVQDYQDGLCKLAQRENELGRFLKSEAEHDKTYAGKMMAAVGKGLSFSSQQRLAVRQPLVRLYQEVETFRFRAVADTLLTVEKMEKSRNEYRGALLWMKDVSEELDPDTFKKLEKFRKVQSQVKKTRADFEKMKLNSLQKIDLLCASRCNLFSHVLDSYLQAWMAYWQKVARTLDAIQTNFNEYQPYEFTVIKDLIEPSQRLAEQLRSTDESSEPGSSDTNQDGGGEASLIDVLSSELPEGGDLWSFESADAPSHVASSEANCNGRSLVDDLLMFDDQPQQPDAGPSHTPAAAAATPPPHAAGAVHAASADMAWFQALIGDAPGPAPPAPVTDDEYLQDLLSVDANEDLMGHDAAPTPAMAAVQAAQANAQAQAQMQQMPGGSWWRTPNQPAALPTHMASQMAPAATAGGFQHYLPSQLLAGMGGLNTQPSGGQRSAASGAATAPAGAHATPADAKKSDHSAWLDLFADLDPLQNPDALGRKEGTEEERKC